MQPKHTKEKLEIYRIYLENYLSVVTNTKAFDSICIIEPFAGQGIEDDGTYGSAVISAVTINKFVHHNKNILLIVNEKDEGKCQKLKQTLSKSIYSKVNRQIFNLEAEQFINTVTSELERYSRLHSLVFIDPYGYTQYSQENINNLLNLDRVDYLFFIPTSHIYRFTGAEENPARKFVFDLGVPEDILNDSNNIDKFADALVSTFKQRVSSDYVYSYKLQNKDSSNVTHHLFFISKNIRGARKFLDAINKVEHAKNKLPFLFPELEESEVVDFINTLLVNAVSNDELYVEGIKSGFLPSKITPVLKKMEKGNKLLVTTTTSTVDRRKGSFYIDDRKKTIHIQKV